MSFLQKYRKKLERKFRPQIKRTGFNFQCDIGLANLVRELARHLECPVYVIAEHTMQLGIAEVMETILDDALRERLQRHLLSDHLLVDHLLPEHETVSRRVQRLQNAMKLLELYEIGGLDPKDVKRALDQVEAEVKARAKAGRA